MSQGISIILFLCILVFGVGCLIAWYIWRTVARRQKHSIPIQYSKLQPKSAYYFRTFQTDISFNYKNPYLDGQSPAWQKAMQSVGQSLDQHSVTHVYFVHGTFVGEDPFGLIPALRRIYPNMSPATELNIRRRVKKSYSTITKDTGNYLDGYVDLFRIASGTKAACQIFNWSSANHHYARIHAALELYRRLIKDLPDVPPSRVLLQGHSHGGQTFAILTHLVNLTHLGEEIWDLLIESKLASVFEKRQSHKLRKCRFDFATFGTPHRYPWRLNKKQQLVNIINHRGKTFLAEKQLGFWKTAGGDYVQQWGIAGSDTLAASSRERDFNRKVDKLLGKGVNPKTWIENLAKGMRVPEAGTTYLVDFRDHSLVVPNFMKTIFGHGVYTRYEAMAFNSQIIVENFYS